MTVTSTLKVYEVDGKAAPERLGAPVQILTVESHYCHQDRVVLHFGAQSVTVLARELEAAVRNATNTGR